MRTVSRPGIAVGTFLALVVPALLWLLGLLAENGVVPADQLSAPVLTAISLSELALGPIGIVMVGRAAHLRGAVAWIGLCIVAVAFLWVVWSLSLLFLSGAIGRPL